MKKKIFLVLTSCIVIMSLSLSVFAHSGKTDSKGGHKDNKNKSGLGSYHYHCGGYPPHLHSGGVCPYKNSSSSSSGKSGGTTTASVPKTVYASSIVAKNVPSKVNVGETTKLEATVSPSNAEDKAISWESSDVNVLYVSNTGELTAISAGTATVTAKTSRGTSKKFTIIVLEVMAENISVENNDKDILIGDTKILTCKIEPENTTNKVVTWTSSDDTVISVSESGEITAKNVGVSTITAIHNGLTDSIDIEVKPIEAKRVKIVWPEDAKLNNQGILQLNEKSKIKLGVEFEPENTTYKDVAWNVSDEEVAFVDEKGNLTAKSKGVAIVTATTKNGVTSEIKIEIYSNVVYTIVGIISMLMICAAATTVYFVMRKRKGIEE